MQAGRAGVIAGICLGLAVGAAAQSHEYIQVGELRATADIVEALNDLPPEAASKVVGALPFHTAVEVSTSPSWKREMRLSSGCRTI